ncbi:MAG TPA: FAD-dependent monooxygenase [Candidatus Baltobacteraceae bacterium]|nr:FAD-dependent monooxygenase [Candidatus Baltobacteraceae bacterium]
MNRTDVDVLICGAGPTGLATAAEAARFGLRYRIIDKAAHGAQYSQALVVQARTLEQFERYEIAQRAIECGRMLHRIRMYSDGKRLLEASFDEIPGSYPFVLFLPQTETERLLAEHVQAQGGNIEREVTLEGFTSGEDSVACDLLHAGGSAERVTAAYLIGADGAHSAVRHLLGMPFEGRSVDFDFFLGDLRVQGDVPADELSVHLHHGNLVFMGRMDDTHCRFIVALHDDPMRREPTLEDFQGAIDLCGIENVRVSDPRWMTAFHISERKTPAYSRGRVFLAGDATNIHSPVGGQGMNTGIQDAANLVWKIALVQRGSARTLLLDSYDAERKPISDALMDTTSVALRAATASNWLLERMRDALLSRIATFDAVQDRLRGAVSEIGINYRRSPIVRDAGGHAPLHGGDRAPDYEVVDETGTRFRLFDLLKEPLHTVIAARPAPDADLHRLAALLRRYRDVMQGSVVVDGDGGFRKQYAPEGGMLYAIRPDGYIGFRGTCSDIAMLEEWAAALFYDTHATSE